jgi:hypothetical protein
MSRFTRERPALGEEPVGTLEERLVVERGHEAEDGRTFGPGHRAVSLPLERPLLMDSERHRAAVERADRPDPEAMNTDMRTWPFSYRR